MNLLRYPGGKAAQARMLVDLMPARLDQYCEPFCGGAAVALEVARRFPRCEIMLTDIDEQITALWWVICHGRVDVLVERYRQTVPTVDEFRSLQGLRSTDLYEMAWAALYLNRTSYSGKEFTSPIGGWDQTGKWKINAEWRPAHIIRTLEEAARLLTGRTVVCCQPWDWGVPYDNWFLYLDPPYYRRGRNMYRHSMTEADHRKLAEWLPAHPDWLLSYDDCPQIRDLYGWAKIYAYGWTYSAGTTRDRGAELVIVSRTPEGRLDV